ncbi:MAG: cation:proton antiporter, partial [Gemmatimonadetes bacterium]|nr:cation:proton antiporter [Gemmatimonadota bacterium]
MNIPLLADVVILLCVSLGVLYLSHAVRIPPVVGFLLTGVLLGPHGLALVRSVHEVDQLAEIGVILVLFAIGLEFSLGDLARMRRTVLLGGTLQVVGIMAAVSAALSFGGMPWRRSLLLGMMASLSSTAIVLRLLQERAEEDAPHGRVALGILVYQDLMIVPMTLLLPVLTGEGGGTASALARFGAKAAVVLVVVLVLARFVVPPLLRRVVGTRSRDMFLLAVVALCLLVAWISAAAGLSLALGAFLAGLVVSESEYSHQAMADILPFRNLFASFFFVSIGMLLDVRVMVASPGVALGVAAGIILVKSVVSGAATLVLGFSIRTAILVGLALSQVGEFSFILAGSGISRGLLLPEVYQWFLVGAVISIGATPFLLSLAPRLIDRTLRLPLPSRLRDGTGAYGPSRQEGLRDHVIVVGFGVNGSNVARAATVARIPFVAVDMNPATVRDEVARGVNIQFGDASQPAVLERAGIGRARVLVVAISDAAATRRVVGLARVLNPACRVIARTRYLREVEPLRSAGAHRVIPEEMETSLEIVARVLASYLVPRQDVETFLEEVRAGGYEMLRSRPAASGTIEDLEAALSDIQISSLRVQDGSALAGLRLDETDLRKLYGLTVVAIRRADGVIQNPGADAVVQTGDILIVLGLNEEVNAASHLF